MTRNSSKLTFFSRNFNEIDIFQDSVSHCAFDRSILFTISRKKELGKGARKINIVIYFERNERKNHNNKRFGKYLWDFRATEQHVSNKAHALINFKYLAKCISLEYISLIRLIIFIQKQICTSFNKTLTTSKSGII